VSRIAVTFRPGGSARALLADEAGERSLDALASRWAEQGELPVAAAFVARDLARLTRHVDGTVLGEADARAVVALVLLVFDALARGATALEVGPHDAHDAHAARLAELGVDAATARLVRGWLDALGGRDEKSAPLLVPLLRPADHGEPTLLVTGAGRLAFARWALAEQRIEASLRARTAPSPTPERVHTILAELPRAGAAALTGAQREAVAAGLTGATTVVTGGPGTGKTSIVVALLRAFLRLPGVGPEALPEIALAAPTGKAADRLREAIAGALAGAGEPLDRALAEAAAPMTLHRLLGYQPDLDRFRFHARSRLPARFVVVDEASMIDTALLFGLLEALPEHAQLVLLGDPDQLPSVGAGAVLRDLTELAPRAPSTVAWAHLEESHRMKESDPAGAHVLGVARRIAAGELPPITTRPLVPGTLGRTETVGAAGAAFAEPSSPAALGRWLDAWFDALPEASELVVRGGADDGEVTAALTAMHAARLLVVTRSAAQRTGQDAVNAYLGARHARRLGRSASAALLPGEPAVVVANDYGRGLFNGDTGLVVAGPEGPVLTLAQRGTVRRLPLADVAHLVERAWALTVHRAQGSEHERVALLLPETDVPRLLTRQIVYTAVTRARRAVTIVGAPALLAAAVARRDERTTGLGRRGG
jgi:exodeoxyribonuclease V alpha subunit